MLLRHISLCWQAIELSMQCINGLKAFHIKIVEISKACLQSLLIDGFKPAGHLWTMSQLNKQWQGPMIERLFICATKPLQLVSIVHEILPEEWLKMNAKVRKEGRGRFSLFVIQHQGCYMPHSHQHHHIWCWLYWQHCAWVQHRDLAKLASEPSFLGELPLVLQQEQNQVHSLILSALSFHFVCVCFLENQTNFDINSR